MKHITKNKVRAHDTDFAGILYFARQFRFIEEALEDFLEDVGLSLDHIFLKEDFFFVIVHAQADYMQPLTLGKELEIHSWIERIGTTSFTTRYEIYFAGTDTLAGLSKTVHVSLDKKTRKKIPIPEKFIKIMEDFLHP